jgi:hypothetical protein
MSHLWSQLQQFFFHSTEIENLAQKLATAIEDAQHRAEAAETPAKKAQYRTMVDRLQRRLTILMLQKERRRITACDQIQEKKYPTFCSDSICSDVSFMTLGIVLESLETKATAVEDWLTMAYLASPGRSTGAFIVINNKAVIAKFPSRIQPLCYLDTTSNPDGTQISVISAYSDNVPANVMMIYSSNLPADKNGVVEIIGGVGPDGVIITTPSIMMECSGRMIAYEVSTDNGTVTVLAANELKHPVIATIPVEEFPVEALMGSLDRTTNRA